MKTSFSYSELISPFSKFEKILENNSFSPALMEWIEAWKKSGVNYKYEKYIGLIRLGHYVGWKELRSRIIRNEFTQFI